MLENLKLKLTPEPVSLDDSINRYYFILRALGYLQSLVTFVCGALSVLLILEHFKGNDDLAIKYWIELCVILGGFLLVKRVVRHYETEKIKKMLELGYEDLLFQQKKF